MTPLGYCLPCISKNGLKLVSGVCSEICGDGILHKLPISGHNCDDGNQAIGDGCNSDCQVESRYTCLRQFNLTPTNYKSKDTCRHQMKITLIRDRQEYSTVRYLLKFESRSTPKTTIKSFDFFKENYDLIFFKNDEDIGIKLSYSFKVIQNRLLVIDIDRPQLKNKMDGRVRIEQKEGSDYHLKDDKDYVVEVFEVQNSFNYDKNAFEERKEQDETLSTIKEIIRHPIVQIFLKILMFSPFFFDMFGKTFQSLIFIRLIDINIPSNLEYFYEIMTGGVNINFGSTPYPKNDYEKPKEKYFIDKILGIEPQDYEPPKQFKKMQFSTLALKSSLFLIVYPLTLYILSLSLIIIRRKFMRKVYDKTSKTLIYVPKNRISRRKAPIFYIVSFLYDQFIWNNFIRCNLFMIQQYLIGIFLNLFYLKFDSSINKISFVVSFILLLIYFVNVIGYFMMTSDMNFNHENKKLSELKILNYFKTDSIFSRNYIIFKMMVVPLYLSVLVTILTNYSRIATGILVLGQMINLGFTCLVRPFESVKLNGRLIVNEILMILIYFINFLFTFGISGKVRNIGGFIVIGLVVVQCSLGFLLRITGYKGI